jgi:hypothetical protein
VELYEKLNLDRDDQQVDNSEMSESLISSSRRLPVK